MRPADGLVLSPDDFDELGTFALRWRWTEGEDALPPVELDRIRPLKASVARSLAPTGPCDAPRGSVVFSCVDAPHGRVRAWLEEQLGATPTPIVVFWVGGPWAVLTDSALFADAWDSFCFPSSDDVTVVPLDRSWTLLWDHEEIFSFWRAGTS